MRGFERSAALTPAPLPIRSFLGPPRTGVRRFAQDEGCPMTSPGLTALRGSSGWTAALFSPLAGRDPDQLRDRVEVVVHDAFLKRNNRVVGNVYMLRAYLGAAFG